MLVEQFLFKTSHLKSWLQVLLFILFRKPSAERLNSLLQRAWAGRAQCRTQALRHLLSGAAGDLLQGPRLGFLREDKVTLDPHRPCGLTKASRMGQAEPEKPAFEIPGRLLCLGCAAMNRALSCDPLCRWASRAGRMGGEVGRTPCTYQGSLCSLFQRECLSSFPSCRTQAWRAAMFPKPNFLRSLPCYLVPDFQDNCCLPFLF